MAITSYIFSATIKQKIRTVASYNLDNYHLSDSFSFVHSIDYIIYVRSYHCLKLASHAVRQMFHEMQNICYALAKTRTNGKVNQCNM